MNPNDKPETPAEQRDAILLTGGYPGYTPRTEWGERYAAHLAPKGHTPSIQSIPNKHITLT